jgi:hypothetical protein
MTVGNATHWWFQALEPGVRLALASFIHLGLSLPESIDLARLHTEISDGDPSASYQTGIDAATVEGFYLRRFPDISMYFGDV